MSGQISGGNEWRHFIGVLACSACTLTRLHTCAANLPNLNAPFARQLRAEHVLKFDDVLYIIEWADKWWEWVQKP